MMLLHAVEMIVINLLWLLGFKCHLLGGLFVCVPSSWTVIETPSAVVLTQYPHDIHSATPDDLQGTLIFVYPEQIPDTPRTTTPAEVIDLQAEMMKQLGYKYTHFLFPYPHTAGYKQKHLRMTVVKNWSAIVYSTHLDLLTWGVIFYTMRRIGRWMI